ncbi:hypothetical protein K4K59_000768 [Colletotrichum sp. SAR11_240]|nr:hypothetical protein K4K59_000768 [Colletotrichum sp. SAR11_240]
MAPVASLYSAVHAAWTEGRLENVLERQKQLALLHGNVKKSSKQLIATIMQELKSSEESAAAELQLVLENIKHHYDVLDFPATLTKEAAVREGSSNMDNGVPLGPTLIDANPFVPVASTLIPLAAAVAAGSAVLVLALSGLPILNTELRRIISASLDVEAVAVTQDDSSDTLNKAISHEAFASVIALESSDSITVDSIGAVAQSLAMSDRGILLIPISSMDHGIDILNKLNKSMPSEIVYAFGDGKAGLYVGSFVKTLQVCVNEVPQWSLGKTKTALKTIARTF